MNAAELDNYLTSKDAYDAALASGKSEDAAKEDAIAALKANQHQQFLRRYGLENVPGFEYKP